MIPLKDWKTKDAIEARREGWFLCCNTHLIQKCDTRFEFRNDDEALQYVFGRAIKGSLLHTRAIKHMMHHHIEYMKECVGPLSFMAWEKSHEPA